MQEEIIIDKFLKKISLKNKGALKLQDDVFFDKQKGIVITLDTFNENIHFLKNSKKKLIIKKVLRASISDLICKGVKPRYYFLSASGNKDSFNKKDLKQIIGSLKEEQSKFGILLSGGDTTFSKTMSFTICVVGFSNSIVKRNNTKLNDDIYVTGNIGDSFIGLKILKNEIKCPSFLKKYFVNAFFMPKIPISIVPHLHKIANSSIDVSDGLLIDIQKMVKNQKRSFEIYLDKVPVSSKLKKIIKLNKFNLEKIIFNGDDYQTVFTAKKMYRKKINYLSSKLNIKITRIGKIIENKTDSCVISGTKRLNYSKYPGYSHFF